MFKAAINAELLKDSIAALAVIVDEVRFKINPEGISVKAVDPANVAMGIFELGSAAFEEYSADECEIGIDLNKITDLLGIAEKTDTVRMELEEKSQKLLIDVGGLSYTLSILDPSTIRAEPRVPQLELPAKVVMNGADLRRAVKAAEKISDHLLMGVSGDTFYMEAKGDTDQVRLEMGRDQLIDLKSGDACSLFSLDYLTDIVKPTNKVNEVVLSLGRDFPVLIDFEIANGAGRISYLLAPRIESD
ncbi:DNA polymerase sliding clamp [Methanosarcina sp. KYL-1]|uniref:DNA polymerase sliding clamp n=1 Tax=Methanosarcina sp. KYL-1 TaxID=2602068 RepID=UPI00210150D1|nr:DNA polymerase sliding clamp [Methanosarcina sp. KYL-1]MCQ1537087.1 DNA polymerase sliding clamp [Methanosarcina sp. KYL-1]